jgi:hypothetical protein
MSTRGLGALRLAVAAAAGSTLLTIGVPQVMAAPATDAFGYVDSTARCSSPDTAVAFGSTDTSRVAICKTPGGKYTYHGVRLRDGAKLVLPATASGGSFVAENDGNTYTVTASSLAVRSGNEAARVEPMVDFHGDLPKALAPSSAPAPAPAPAPPPSSTVPLPPPLPAEVGG